MPDSEPPYPHVVMLSHVRITKLIKLAPSGPAVHELKLYNAFYGQFTGYHVKLGLQREPARARLSHAIESRGYASPGCVIPSAREVSYGNNSCDILREKPYIRLTWRDTLAPLTLTQYHGTVVLRDSL